MRYYIKCKLNPEEKQGLADSIQSGFLAHGKIFYEGMQTALREATIDEDDIVHFVEICYCLEGGLYPMAMEIPVLREYFNKIIEVKDARFRDQCTMECEFCDCTRNIKLPGKRLVSELGINNNESIKSNFIDVGRLNLNRKKQKEGIQELRSIISDNYNNNFKLIFAGAAVSGLFAIFYDYECKDYFRIKGILDTEESRQLLEKFGSKINSNDSVESMKLLARRSLANSDKRSNVV
jgi:hypothetical protein